MMKTISVISMFLMTMASSILAQSTAPSSQPTDLSPKQAMKALEAAAARGDAATLLSLIETSTPTEQKYVQAFADNSSASYALRQAISARFPDDAKAGNESIAKQLDGINSAIDGLEEKIDGDNATLGPPGAGDAMQMKFVRINGKWERPFDSMFMGATNLDATANNLNSVTTVIRGITADTLAGKFSSMDEVKKAGEMRMIQATIAQEESTRPSSAPATQP